MKRCLIVDDSDVIRKVARRYLESLGYDVAEADNGRAGLDACLRNPPDVVLLDWQLPGMTTVEFLSAIRLAPTKKRSYIVYCTTENDHADISRAFVAGADDYFLKPFDRPTFVDKFSQLPHAA